MPPQVVMLTPILEGLDGTKKMSKSLGNYIGISESPAEMFGKIMSISDPLMERYYELLLRRKLPAEMHPLEAKKQLGAELVRTYHSVEAADKAAQDWTARFSEKRLSEAQLPEFLFIPEEHGSQAVAIVWSMYAFLSAPRSRTDVRRLIEQGSVQINGVRVSDPKAALDLKPGQIVRLDKTRAVRIG
jgi:tyrosyl-tRNA synthetase